jgi:hypothetical protein
MSGALSGVVVVPMVKHAEFSVVIMYSVILCFRLS